jgi:tRNA G26 N,N-dimethylase Trm1
MMDGALILIELSLFLFIVVRVFVRARRNSRVRRVQKSVKEALAKEVCPTCTTELARMPATTLYEPCSCCGSIWRRN